MKRFPSKRIVYHLNRYPLGGCGNIIYDASTEYYHASIVRIANIAATPKGVAIYFFPIMLRGEEARFAHLIPSLWYRNPTRGCQQYDILPLND